MTGLPTITFLCCPSRDPLRWFSSGSWAVRLYAIPRPPHVGASGPDWSDPGTPKTSVTPRVPELREPPSYFASIANEYSVSPAATTRYCVPSNSYVIGPFVTEFPRFACHSGFPFAGSIATRLPDPSPANSNFPAVDSRPDRPPSSHL